MRLPALNQGYTPGQRHSVNNENSKDTDSLQTTAWRLCETSLRGNLNIISNPLALPGDSKSLTEAAWKGNQNYKMYNKVDILST